MEDKIMIAKQAQPLLQTRIVKVLDNPNAGAGELSELIAETELAIIIAKETVSSERASATDLIGTPSPEAAQAAISRAEAAKINHDRLSGVLPKLRDRYTEALATERRDRWASDYKKIETARDKLREEYNAIHQAYLSAKAKRDDLIQRMAACDLDVRRVNTIAGDLGIWDRQLEPLLESAAPERTWGPPRIANGGLAVALAQSMAPPTYDPADWSKPEVQARRRAEVEKQHREIGEHYQTMTVEQEDRINREERERMSTLKAGNMKG
jgi:hypothetical protein